MYRHLILFMAVLLFIEPLQAHALKATNYQLDGPIQFGDADRIAGSPFHKDKYLPTEKEVALLGLIPLNARAIFSPAGFFATGAVRIISPTVTLMRKIENLNKVIKEINPQKTAILLPYLGLDGMDLFSSFLQGKQKVREGGKLIRTTLFASNGKRKSGVSVLLMRDMVNSFIQQFQQAHARSVSNEDKKCPLVSTESEDYDKDLDRFLSELGFVTWRDKTIRALQQVWPNLSTAQCEVNLYTKLREKRVLDHDGAALAKITTTYVLRCLKRLGIKDEHVHRLVLHDLGLVHRRDVEELRFALEGELSKDGQSKVFRNRVQQSLDLVADCLERELDGSPVSEVQFKQKIDLAILQGLVSGKEMKAYLKKHGVHLEKKHLLEKIAIFKLALVESINQEHYHYFSLEEDLMAVEAFVMKVFHSQEIDNDVYRIVSLKKEDLAIAGLTYISGIGFISLGVLDIIIRTIQVFITEKVNMLALATQAQSTSLIDQLTEQIAALTQVVNGLNYAFSSLLVGVGAITLLLNAYAIIKTAGTLKRMKNGNKIYALLEEHIRETVGKEENLSSKQRDLGDAILFNAMTHHYLKKLEKKSLINSLGLNFIWSGLGALSMLNGITGILILAGVSAAVGIGAAANIATFAFVGVIILPSMLLIFREIRLKEKLVMASNAVEEMQKALICNNPDLERKKVLFLNTFFSNVKEAIGLGVCYSELIFYQSCVAQSSSFEQIESNLVELYRVRRHALRYWKKIKNRSIEDQERLKQIIEDGLGRQNIQLRPGELEELKPSTFRNGVDFLLESFHPGVSRGLSGEYLSKFSFPKYDGIYRYENDVTLSALFNHTYRVYKNVTSSMKEYRYLVRKKQLQERYFKRSLTKSEYKLLHNRLKKRQEDNWFILHFQDLPKLVDSLRCIHKRLPEGVVVAWDEQFFPQLHSLIELDKCLQRKIKKHFVLGQKTNDISLPDLSRIELLIQYFIPLDKLAS